VPITPEAGRVLGCLVEKQLTTPQQYPLTENALSLACSQTTNRDPVVVMDEGLVQGALLELKEHRLVRFVLPSHGRSVKRFRHVLDEIYGLDGPCLGVFAVLLLRGPQTPGELRARTGRMASFGELGNVQDQLEWLAARPEDLVRLVPREPGQKEDRWQQLLAEEWESRSKTTVNVGTGPSDTHPLEPLRPEHRRDDASPPGTPLDEDSDANVSALRTDLERVRAELSTLRASVTELGASLDELRRSLGG
jgi:uncharacterized protein YceH (UPF0502 family)